MDLVFIDIRFCIVIFEVRYKKYQIFRKKEKNLSI